jgi:hypothetical protein
MLLHILRALLPSAGPLAGPALLRVVPFIRSPIRHSIPAPPTLYIFFFFLVRTYY